MKHFIQILVLCIGIPVGAGAQTFTQRLQKQPSAGQGSVTIHQSDSIDKLVNTTVLTTTKSSTTTKTSTPSATSHTSATSTTSKSTAIATATQPVETPDTTNLSQKMIRNGHKVMGYRVQAFAGGNSRKDRQKVPVYVHFYSPRWICRVGNYRTYEEAHQMLVSLRELGFDQATIVKGKITVAY